MGEVTSPGTPATPDLANGFANSYVRQSGVLTGPVLGVAQTCKAATA
jgi:hypothetical protein